MDVRVTRVCDPKADEYISFWEYLCLHLEMQDGA